MTISYRCPHCGHSGATGDEYAGQSGPCAACGETMTFPFLDTATTGALSPRRGANKSSRGTAFYAVIGIAVLIFCGVGILVAMSRSREAVRRVQCANHMKQISLAMHSYHLTHGTLPPAYTVDQEGRPLHSWRTLLLPYLGQQTLYDQIKLSEPWNSPHNRRFHDAVLSVYRCPKSPDPTAGTTNYMVVVGEETLFPPGGQQRAYQNATDGARNTIMLVEVERGTNWMEPVDISFDEMVFNINGGPGEIASGHPGGANVALADGSVHQLEEDIKPRTLRALLTKAGGEVVEAW